MIGRETTFASSLVRSIPLPRSLQAKDRTGTLGVSVAFAIGLVVIALVSLLYLSQTSAVASTGYDVKRLQDEQAQLQMRNGQLRMRVAQLQSLDRVDAEARARLKMGLPDKVLYVPVEAPQP